MSKADDQRIANLARKNAAKAAKPPKEKLRRQYDNTLRPESDDDADASRLFSEMKKREF